MMKIVIVTATEKEMLLLQQKTADIFSDNPTYNIDYLVSGVGVLASCFAIAEYNLLHKPDLMIQCGIAGALNTNTPLGSVYAISDEAVADAGVYESGIFKDLFDLELAEPNDPPFTNKMLSNPYLHQLNCCGFETIKGITVNEITTDEESISWLNKKFINAVESMEGASLHYCCLKTNTPFIQLRAVSNIVGERNKANWKIQPALENLSNCLKEFLIQFAAQQQTK